MTAHIVRPGQPLSRREVQVLRLKANGHTDADIAQALGVVVRTIQSHIIRIRMKLGAANATHAVALALQAGMLGPSPIVQTYATAGIAAAAQGPVKRLHTVWRSTRPPKHPELAGPWWQRRLEELANAISEQETSK